MSIAVGNRVQAFPLRNYDKTVHSFTHRKMGLTGEVVGESNTGFWIVLQNDGTRAWYKADELKVLSSGNDGPMKFSLLIDNDLDREMVVSVLQDLSDIFEKTTGSRLEIVGPEES